MAYTRKMAGKVPVLKQDLVFDATPTPGSENVVTSGGVAKAVDDAKAEAAQISDGGAKTESDLVDGALSIGEPNSVTKLTLTTALTLTVLANEGVPNFALEIDNSGNSNGVTVTVKDSTGTDTLKHSSVAGATVAANTVAQITAVGNCWAFTYFEA